MRWQRRRQWLRLRTRSRAMRLLSVSTTTGTAATTTATHRPTTATTRRHRRHHHHHHHRRKPVPVSEYCAEIVDATCILMCIVYSDGVEACGYTRTYGLLRTRREDHDGGRLAP